MTRKIHAASSSRDRRWRARSNQNELRRRSAIKPVTDHLKAEGHLDRCYLKDGAGDAANAILSAVGCNFRRIRVWLRVLLPIPVNLRAPLTCPATPDY